MTHSVKAASQMNFSSKSLQTVNGVDFSIDNRTQAVVQVILMEKSVAEIVADITGKPYKDLYSLLVNGSYLIEAEQVENPEDKGLAYYFANTSQFIIGEKDDLITLKAIKSNSKSKDLYLRKHPKLDGYVVTSYPTAVMAAEKILKMAQEVFKSDPQIRASNIVYNDYGALLMGNAFYWASNIDQEMKPVKAEMKKNGIFHISDSTFGVGVVRSITGRMNGLEIQSVFINHFPTKKLEIA